jgi:hypothetical protein
LLDQKEHIFYIFIKDLQFNPHASLISTVKWPAKQNSSGRSGWYGDAQWIIVSSRAANACLRQLELHRGVAVHARLHRRHLPPR